METEILSPANDWIFKLLFGDERNKSILIDLLDSFVELPKEEFEMVAVKNPEIRKAVDTLYELSSDDQVRAEYEQRQKAWRDRNSQIEGYYLDGIAVGEQRGEQRGIGIGKLEIARKMKEMGDSDEKIYALTGITQDRL